MSHQVEYAGYLKAGFEKLGFHVFVTSDRTDDADLHLVQGPHYAYRENIGKRTILLDRCFWGHPRRHVTLAGLDDSGNKIWPVGAPDDRDRPRLRPWNTLEQRVIVLNDYETKVQWDYLTEHFDVEVREHPARIKPMDTLGKALSRNDIAVGFNSTALVSAAIAGLPVVSQAAHSPVHAISSGSIDELVRPDREPWINNLSYMNWSAGEIASGEALEYVLCHYQ